MLYAKLFSRNTAAKEYKYGLISKSCQDARIVVVGFLTLFFLPAQAFIFQSSHQNELSLLVERTVICIFPTYKLQQVFSRASGKNLILQENVTRLNETGRVNYDAEKQKNDWGVILWMLFFLWDDEWTVLAVHSSRNMPINSLRLLLYSHTVMRKILPDRKQLRLLENRTKNAAYMFQHCYDFFLSETCFKLSLKKVGRTVPEFINVRQTR